MSKSRTRTTRYDRKGSYTYTDAPSGIRDRVVQGLATHYASCTDVVGARQSDNALNITKTSPDGFLLINGKLDRNIDTPQFPQWDSKISFDNFPVAQGAYPSSLFAFLQPRYSDDKDWTRLQAMTNPSRATVSLPQFVAELKDLPRMLHHGLHVLSLAQKGPKLMKSRVELKQIEDARNQIRRFSSEIDRSYPKSGSPFPRYYDRAKELAIANLALQFGWLPMVNDVVSMFSLAQAMEARRKEIDRLHSGNGLRRRVRLGTVSGSSSGTFQYYAGSVVNQALTANFDIQKTVERWGTINWKPISKPTMPVSDDQLWRTLTGLSLSAAPALLWELLPWSWLIDYFTNVGTWMSSKQNEMNAYVAKACLMTHSRNVLSTSYSTYQWTSPNPPYRIMGRIGLSPEKLVHESKTRVGWPASGPSLGFSFSFLNEKQVSILSSIGMTKGIRQKF